MEMIQFNNKLYFTSIPKESEIGPYSNKFYFVKGTVGCRGTHSYLYEKYNISEESEVKYADIIVMEWPTFKPVNLNINFQNETTNLNMNETVFFIDKYKKYFETVEELWRDNPHINKIGVDTFLSNFLTDREQLTKDKFLDLFKKMSSCKTQESANVLMSNIVNIDLKYKKMIGCLLYAGQTLGDFSRFTYGSAFFRKSKHSSIPTISTDTLLSYYYNNNLDSDEDKIVEEIIDENQQFFTCISEIKRKWKQMEVKLSKKNNKVEVLEDIKQNCDWNIF
jgi:hypothetical protein